MQLTVKRYLFILLLGLTPTALTNGQVGGNHIYEFLNLTHSGLVTSLGGSNVSLNTDNVNLAYHNPALLNAVTGNHIALNYVNYYAGINYGLASYGWSANDNRHKFAACIAYINYGKFTEADETGNITGKEFGASEFAFPFLYSKALDSLFNIGITLKPVISHLENYTSFGFAFDMGATYHNKTGLLSAGLVFRNAGMQLKSYNGEPLRKTPFEIEAGISKKLAHAPFRLSLTIRHIERYNLIYDYGTSDKKSYLLHSKFMENVFRHLLFAAEFIPHKCFYVSTGFNYQRRKELGLNTKPGNVGFSWGFGFNTSFLNMEFGRSSYHLAGPLTNLSLILKPKHVYKHESIPNH